MGEYGREQRSQLSRVIDHSESKSSQLKGFVDNRPKAVSQAKLIASIQKKPNNTGLPDNLKSGIENLSGYSLDDVKMHYNSDKPTQLRALAYAQGADIHVAPGQEKHLPQEAWHVVQQKQGRVQPTMQMQGVNVNDNEGLEREAGRMSIEPLKADREAVQMKLGGDVIQRKVGMEFQTVGGERNVFGVRCTLKAANDKKVAIYEGCVAPTEIHVDDGFKITRDANTDLEYITISSDNRDEVVDRANKAGEAHVEMSTNANNTITVQYDEKPYCNCSLYKDFIAINRDGEKTAHPQATIGIMLAGIPDLIEQLSKSKIGGTKKPYAKKQKESLKAVSEKAENIENVTAKCKGLIMLLEQYIHVANNMFSYGYAEEIAEEKTKTGNYKPNGPFYQISLTKDTMPIMSRTSILLIYNSLSIEEKCSFLFYFQKTYSHNLDTLVTFCSKSTKDPTLDKSVDAITLGEFLYELHHDSGHDAMRMRKSEENPIVYCDEVSIWDKSNFDGIEDGIAVELRALERNVSPDRWGEIAGKVFDAVSEINKPKKEENGQEEEKEAIQN